MNVIGLGQAGCNIADLLSVHPQYKAYKIDVMMLSIKRAQKNTREMFPQ